MEKQHYEDDTKEISYTLKNITSEKKMVSYDIKDKQTGKSCSFMLDDGGFLSIKKDNKTLVRLSLNLDEANPVYNSMQHGCVSAKKNLGVDSIEGLMSAYKKVANKDFNLYNAEGNAEFSDFEKEKVAQYVTAFMGGCIFNTPESREVLGEYLAAPAKEDRQKTAKANEEKINALKTPDAKQAVILAKLNARGK